ncbi:MAG: cytochrome c oxidase subunit 3 [Planctomycetota bacterium]
MTVLSPEHADADHGHHGDHPPHLAHHFDTPEQQFDSAKVGMWAFLATEILMFGGLFVAYAVYRYNNPDVFKYSADHLKWSLGATNTLILLASSLTMALAVRAAQLGQQSYLKLMLAMTLLGGVGFMVIKTVEYTDKFNHGLFPGRWNVYDRQSEGGQERFASYIAHEQGAAHHDEHSSDSHAAGSNAHHEDDDHEDHHADGHAETPDQAVASPVVASDVFAMLGPDYVDPNAGTGDAAIHRPTIDMAQLSISHDAHNGDGAHAGGKHSVAYGDLSIKEQSNLKAFFGIYYMMTDLHGIHVLIGMGLIGWVLIKSLAGTFGPAYFTPVDLVGLYWHIVDLIWIFLFPLLYLIH